MMARGKSTPVAVAPVSISAFHSQTSTDPNPLPRCSPCLRECVVPRLLPLPPHQTFLRENPIPRPESRWDRRPVRLAGRNCFVPTTEGRWRESGRTAQSSFQGKNRESRSGDMPGLPWKGNYTGHLNKRRIRSSEQQRELPHAQSLKNTGKFTWIRSKRFSKIPR